MPPVPIRWVLIRDPKEKFHSQALLCTDLHLSPEQIMTWFVRRWQVEVTFHEVRTHLGVETQRQWAGLAILRITPALPGLVSLVTLLADVHTRHKKLCIQRTAWYDKKLPTFSDALATVRQEFWVNIFFGYPIRQARCKIGRFYLPVRPFWLFLSPSMDKV